MQERSQQASVADATGDGTAETTSASEGGTEDAFSVLVGMAESDSNAATTDHGSGVDQPAVLWRRATGELSDYWDGPRDNTGSDLGSEPTRRGWPTCSTQLQMKPMALDALLAAAENWTMTRRPLLTAEEEMALMAGTPEMNKIESGVCVRIGFPADV